MAEKLADLIKKLSDEKVEDRIRAAEKLGEMGEDAQGAALALVRACADSAEEVRQSATGTLESLGPPDPRDVAGLIGLLEDTNADVAYWAATLLGRLEADAAAAIPGLVKVLGSEGPLAVRERSAWALGKIGPDAKEALDLLERVAQKSDTRLASLAAESVEQIKEG